MSQPSLEHSLRNYYAEVERGLVCSGSVKRRTVQALRTSVEDFLAGSPDASFADVVERFGTPGQIADEALEALSPAELRRYARQSHMMWCALVLFIGGFFFLGLCAFAIPAVVSAVESIQIDPSRVHRGAAGHPPAGEKACFPHAAGHQRRYERGQTRPRDPPHHPRSPRPCTPGGRGLGRPFRHHHPGRQLVCGHGCGERHAGSGARAGPCNCMTRKAPAFLSVRTSTQFQSKAKYEEVHLWVFTSCWAS